MCTVLLGFNNFTFRGTYARFEALLKLLHFPPPNSGCSLRSFGSLIWTWTCLACCMESLYFFWSKLEIVEEIKSVARVGSSGVNWQSWLGLMDADFLHIPPWVLFPFYYWDRELLVPSKCWQISNPPTGREQTFDWNEIEIMTHLKVHQVLKWTQVCSPWKCLNSVHHLSNYVLHACMAERNLFRHKRANIFENEPTARHFKSPVQLQFTIWSHLKRLDWELLLLHHYSYYPQ